MTRNIYNILRLDTQIKSRRLKLLGIWLFHVLGKRYIGVFLDPVLACNFRCKMCYFSDEEKRKSLRGTLKYEEIEAIAGSLFHRALKLQIGCGAEPTLHKDLVKIIALGKQYNVPYVSLTTNGNLLTKEQLAVAVENGLDELTLSAHGFTRETYEHLMTNGKFDLFRRAARRRRRNKETTSAVQVAHQLYDQQRQSRRTKPDMGSRRRRTGYPATPPDTKDRRERIPGFRSD